MDKIVILRCSEEDRDIIGERFSDLGFKSASAFIREAVRFYDPKDIDQAKLKEYRG